MTRVPTHALLAVGLSIVASAAIAGCGSQAAPAWSFPPAAVPVAAPVAAAAPAAPAAPEAALAAPVVARVPASSAGAAQTGAAAAAPGSATAAAPATRLDLTIVTGDMIGKTEFPAYIPSDFTLPANSTVVVTITNFDDATPLPAAYLTYSKVSGTVGNTMQVTPIDPKAPNGSAGPTQTLSGLDPKAVSHTFTIAGLGINVPVAAHARTTFTIRTGAAGTFAWRCNDPCGAGSSGWGTAMAAKSGYMEGTLTVN